MTPNTETVQADKVEIVKFIGIETILRFESGNNHLEYTCRETPDVAPSWKTGWTLGALLRQLTGGLRWASVSHARDHRWKESRRKSPGAMYH